MTDLTNFNALAETARKRIEDLMLEILEHDSLAQDMDGGTAAMSVMSGTTAAIANTVLALDGANVLLGDPSIQVLCNALFDHWRQAKAGPTAGGGVQ